MSFLGGPNRSGESRTSTSTSKMPDLGGPQPSSVKEPARAMPPVCMNCGKDPSQAPAGTEPEVVKMMFSELERADGLSPWEDKFIADVQSAYERFGRLSPKQHSTLVKIHDEKVVNGGSYRTK